MMEKTARAAEQAREKAVQRCIDAACGGTYGIRERIYVCPRCGGPLEIEVPARCLRAGEPCRRCANCGRRARLRAIRAT